MTGKASSLLLLGAVMVSGPLLAQHDGHHHPDQGSALTTNDIRRTVASYEVPNLTLVRQDGKPMKLRDELADSGPVFVNFVFTSCTTVCPVMTQIFSQLQGRLGKDKPNVRLISISIDPLEDTPARLTAYGKQFGAGATWHFLTGTAEASIAAQRAFDVYRGDKMNHPVASFFRRDPRGSWVRIDGFASADQLLAELHRRD